MILPVSVGLWYGWASGSRLLSDMTPGKDTMLDMKDRQFQVLVVEDDRAHAELIEGRLRDDGRYQVTGAATLAAAYEQMATQKPDLVLLDLNLPDGNALVFLTDWCASCPMLIMTSQGSETLAVESLKSGALDYIVKSPEAFAQMPRIVARSLREWQLKTDREEAIAALRESELQLRKLSQAVEQSPSAVLITDLDGRIEYVNPKFTEVTGYARNEVIGETPRILNSGQMDSLVYRQLWAHLAAGKRWQGELLNRHKQGHLFWERAQIAPLRDEQGCSTHYIAVKEDITVQKEYEQQLRHMATHDELTGLANRTLFNNLLERAIPRAERSGHQVAVILLDLDRFKVINDSLGHAFGDELLCLVAQRLQQLVRETDTVVRFGGDEFIVLLPDISGAAAAGKVADKIMRCLSRPYRIAERELVVTASLGLSMAPVDGKDGATLIRKADVAMYQSKRKRDDYSFYTEKMNLHVFETLELENDLRRALDNQELVLHYQPKVDLKTGRIAGCEALLRWHHPQRGMVSPGKFIPLAEETGMIAPIGSWVIEEACRQSLAWQATGYPPIRIAVNLSARQFRQGDLVTLVGNLLQQTGLSAELLELELTESMVMDNPQQTAKTLSDLKHLGVSLSLDDFGTGYSSLNYLRRFPVDSLKIDQSFISDVASDRSGASVVASIIDIAHNLNLLAIAEGVETEEQRDFLVTQGCDLMQGYLFSRPLPAPDFIKLFDEEKLV